jgi:hypothetical protein
MPLARIFTRNPERTVDLSSQLKQQGYKVEVVSPDHKHLAPADLEIEFELCERADVLERAADLANELEADVAVGPGILQAAPELAVEPIAQSALHAMAEDPVEMKPDQALKNQALQSDAEREFEAAFSPTTEMPEVPAPMQTSADVIEIPIMEQAQSAAKMPPVAFMEEPAAMEPVRIAKKPAIEVPVHFAEPVPDQAMSADPVPYLSQLTPFSSSVARTETPQVSQSVRSQEKTVPVADRGKQALQDGAKIAAKTWAGAQALASSTADSVRDHFRVYKKRAQVRSAEQRAAHAARLLDLEQRRAEAQQRASELEAARVAASVRLNELLQQRTPGLPEQRLQEQRSQEQRQYEQGLREQSQREHGLWQPSTYAHTVPKEERKREVPATAASYRPIPPVPRTAKSAQAAVKNTPAALWSKVNPPLRAVLTGAAAVSALFIMGIALGIFHSRAPLASPANHASGVMEKSGAVPAQTGETAQAALAKPEPGTGSQSAVQAEAKTQSPAKPSPRIQRAAQLVAQQSETNIGDDVVIRHFSRPVPTAKPKQSGQQAGLKHFSDLDN